MKTPSSIVSLHTTTIIFIITYILICFIVNNTIGQQQQIVDAKGGFKTPGDLYTLLWEVQQNIITFRAKVRGTGFVGFGISQTGGMSRADVYLVGIYPNGTTYAHDARENGAGTAPIDQENNYQLQYAQDDGIFTEVHFSRYLDTGDYIGDLPIINATQYVIWSVGPPTDTLSYHGVGNRGVVRVNLLNQRESGTFTHTPVSNRLYK